MRTVRGTRAGFTLIELLVVMALLALLAGLLIPAAARALETAHAAQCRNRMRQLGTIAMVYTTDHGNRFPRSQHSAFAYGDLPWGRSFAPYLGADEDEWRSLLDTVYHCPRDERSGRFSYGLNVYMELGPGDDYRGAPRTWWRRSDLRAPSATILFAENNSYADHIMPNFWGGPGDAHDCAHDRHDGKAHYVFADGHVEARTLEAVYNPADDIDAWHPDLAR